jgi:hypothetical protein
MAVSTRWSPCPAAHLTPAKAAKASVLVASGAPQARELPACPASTPAAPVRTPDVGGVGRDHDAHLDGEVGTEWCRRGDQRCRSIMETNTGTAVAQLSHVR